MPADMNHGAELQRRAFIPVAREAGQVRKHTTVMNMDKTLSSFLTIFGSYPLSHHLSGQHA